MLACRVGLIYLMRSYPTKADLEGPLLRGDILADLNGELLCLLNF
jgi:hypothetical protein